MMKLTLTVLSILLLASVASAADVFDAKGKRIGTVIAQTPYPHPDAFSVLVIASHNGVGYLVRMGRQGFTGSDWLYYPTENCTGAPVSPMKPAYRTDILVHPSGIDLNGDIWIMRRIRMTQQGVRSFVYTGGGYHGADPPSCEPAAWHTDDEGWVSPMVRVGNLKTLFTPPYSVR